MLFCLRLCALFAAVLSFLHAPTAARAAFISYTFTTDSADAGGALSGSFLVDQADLLDGVLSTADVQEYTFTFTAPGGGTTHYALSGIFPDLPVDPTTGVPTGLDGSVVGEQVGDSGTAQAFLTLQALTPNASFWVAITRPTDETDSGLGHWDISPAGANPAPVPGGIALGLIGAGCLALGRLVPRRTARTHA